MNGFAGYLLLTPDNFIVVHSPGIRENYEILSIRQCDPIPVISFFNKATRYCLKSGIFISVTDLVHSRKIENSSGVVNVFAVDYIPQNQLFAEEKRNFSA